MTSELDPFLLEILVDPEDKQPLFYFADENVLYNPRLKRNYAVRDGIPILLVDEAIPLDAKDVARLEANLAEALETGHPAERS